MQNNVDARDPSTNLSLNSMDIFPDKHLAGRIRAAVKMQLQKQKSV